MNLAILHYHLNRGGVTRVIENQLSALDAVIDDADDFCRVAVIFGGRREGWNEELPAKLTTLDVGLHVVPSLDYDDEGGSARLPDDLSRLLRQIGFAPHATVLHVHNHSLGKNRSLPASLLRLSDAGYALLLQIHDFGEDFRPANYRRLIESGLAQESGPAVGLYPQAGHIHYAVLNGRDETILGAAGVLSERLHRLPNPVPKMDDLPSRARARRHLAERFDVAEHQPFVLYPVRCIRRKNVGEALLYAALAPPGTVVGLTLPPLNPREVPIYESWKKLAAELDLPCRFDVGVPGGLSFAENLAAADLFLTTSLAEGFGMVFLESTLAGRPLIGRDLPEVTRDFTDVGIRLDWLRPRLLVPLQWIGSDAFRKMTLGAYRETLVSYGKEEPDDVERTLQEKTHGGLVDFGDLDEALQQQVLQAVCRNDDRRRSLLERNPWIGDALSIAADDAIEAIRHNSAVIEDHYSHQPSGHRLLEIYRQVGNSPRNETPGPLPRGRQILDTFLDFRRFRPIRT